MLQSNKRCERELHSCTSTNKNSRTVNVIAYKINEKVVVTERLTRNLFMPVRDKFSSIKGFVSLNTKLYPHFSGLVQSRNIFECDLHRYKLLILQSDKPKVVLNENIEQILPNKLHGPIENETMLTRKLTDLYKGSFDLSNHPKQFYDRLWQYNLACITLSMFNQTQDHMGQIMVLYQHSQ